MMGKGQQMEAAHCNCDQGEKGWRPGRKCHLEQKIGEISGFLCFQCSTNASH